MSEKSKNIVLTESKEKQEKILESIGKTQAKAITEYMSGELSSVQDQGNPVDLFKENSLVSSWLIWKLDQGAQLKAIIVPGFTSKMPNSSVLHKIAKERLKIAVDMLLKEKDHFIVVSGGNIKSSPYNEALEMKRYLLKEYSVPGYLVAIEPFAQNSVMNLRNSARFMLSHNIKEGVIVTSKLHNIYYGYPRLSGFSLRSLFLLGHTCGQLSYKSQYKTNFQACLQNLDKPKTS